MASPGRWGQIPTRTHRCTHTRLPKLVPTLAQMHTFGHLNPGWIESRCFQGDRIQFW